MKVDTANKIVLSCNVFQCVNDLYSLHNGKSKEEKRAVIQAELCGKMVMANYGNSRYWRIDEIVFDLNCEDIIVDKTTNMNMLEYYKSKYNIDVKIKKQPLIRTINKDRLQKDKIEEEQDKCYLLPELMLMTGLPDNFD